jgi:uncharacterized protein YraI
MRHLLDKQTFTGRGRRLPLHGRFSTPTILLVAWLLLVAGACTPPAVEPGVTPDVVESAPSPTATATAPPVLQAAPTATMAPTETPAIVPTATAVEPTPLPSPTAAPESDTVTYQVIFVAEDDVLNVRTGPGAGNPVAGELLPDATHIMVAGPGEDAAGSLWVPIVAGPLSGWVNSQFLTESVDGDVFCNDPAVEALLEALSTAVAAHDGEALARLVHPEHGLRIHRHWWNPEVRVDPGAVADLFSGDQSYDWGMADGTGDEMRGPFSLYIQPLLERNLLPATETACNEILHGSTAGLVQLPEGYESANYYAVYRPAGEGMIEFDWGAWVVGIEQWQGAYYISFLVHFEWEI